MKAVSLVLQPVGGLEPHQPPAGSVTGSTATFLAVTQASRGRSGGGEEEGRRRKGRRCRRLGVRPSRPKRAMRAQKKNDKKMICT
jgi:hypothetical protein